MFAAAVSCTGSDPQGEGGNAGGIPPLTAAHREIEGATVKKGVCVSRYDDGSDLGAQNLKDLNISWYYNWGAETPTDKIEAEYVPMVWGAGSVNDRTLSKIRSGVERGDYRYVLAFNEPDAATPGVSSGISVQTALDLWPQLEALGAPLSSPAPTYYASGWLDAFMQGAKERGYRVDFIALHCYQDFSDPNAPQALKEELTRIYETYQLPIWITEFAAIDITVWGGGSGKPACTQEAALRYAKETTDMLESLGFVERYAWFIDNTGSPSETRGKEAQYTWLYENDDAISETGKTYRNQVSRFPLRLADEVLPAGRAGEPYAYLLTAEGGRGDYVFSTDPEQGGNAPDGFQIDGSGQLYGLTKRAGLYRLHVTVTDEDGQWTFRDYVLPILA